MFERDEASILRLRKKSEQQLVRVTLLAQIEERKKRRESCVEVQAAKLEELRQENIQLKERFDANSKLLESYTRASSALLEKPHPRKVFPFRVKSLGRRPKRLTAPQSPFARNQPNISYEMKLAPS